MRIIDLDRDAFLRLAKLAGLEAEDPRVAEELFGYVLNVGQLIRPLNDLHISLDTEPAAIYVLGLSFSQSYAAQLSSDGPVP